MASLAIFLCPDRVGVVRLNAPGGKPSYATPIWNQVEDMDALLSEPALLAGMIREAVGDESAYDVYLNLYPGTYSEIVFSHDKRKPKELERLRQSELETVFHGEYSSLYTYDLLLDKGKPSFNGKSRRLIFTISRRWVDLVVEAFTAQKLKLVRLAPMDAAAAESALRYWAPKNDSVSLVMTLDEACTSIAFLKGGNVMAMRTTPNGFGAILELYQDVTGFSAEDCRSMILANGVYVSPDDTSYMTIQDEVLRTANRLATDVAKTLLNTFGNDARLGQVLLCGNFARTNGLKEYFDTALETDCAIAGTDTIDAAAQQAICLNSADLELLFPLAATAAEGADLLEQVKKARKERKQNVTLCVVISVLCVGIMAAMPVMRLLLNLEQKQLRETINSPEYAEVHELYQEKTDLQKYKNQLTAAVEKLPHGESNAAGMAKTLLELTGEYGTVRSVSVDYRTGSIQLEFTTQNYDSFVYWQNAITGSEQFSFLQPPTFSGNGLTFTVKAVMTATDFD